MDIDRPDGTLDKFGGNLKNQRLKPLARLWAVPMGGASVKDLSGGQIQRAASPDSCTGAGQEINAVGMADTLASHGW